MMFHLMKIFSKNISVLKVTIMLGCYQLLMNHVDDMSKKHYVTYDITYIDQ